MEAGCSHAAGGASRVRHEEVEERRAIRSTRLDDDTI